MKRTALMAAIMVATGMGLAGCDHNDRTGMTNPNPTVGQAVGNAADNTKQGMDNLGTKARDTLDPPRGPAERMGRSIDRTLNP